MNEGDRLAARSLWRRTAAVGVALVIAALAIAAATLWDARSLDSAVGEGTSFSIILPLTPPEN